MSNKVRSRCLDLNRREGSFLSSSRSLTRDVVAFSWKSVQAGPDTFKVLGLQQIAIGALSKQNLQNLWGNMLGVPTVGTFQSESENVDEDILKLGEGPYAVEIDLMEPLDPNRSPKVHIPSLNHIGLWVDNLANAVEELSNKGVRFAGGIRPGASGHDVAFIHPKGSKDLPIGGEGVLLELVQAPKEVIDALS